MIKPYVLPSILPLIAVSACHSGGSGEPPPAAPPPASLATDRILFDSDRSGTYEIYAMDEDGGNVAGLTQDDTYDTWWPRLSPNRRRIVFYRTPAGVHDTDYARTSLWVMNADGSGQAQLLAQGANGWALQGHGEWSPDGSRLVMFGGPALPQIYVTRPDGTQPLRVTDGAGVWLDPSWSPDGGRLAFVGCPALPCDPVDYDVYTMSSAGGESPVALARDAVRDHDPYYSPDGGQIAWLTQDTAQPIEIWNIRIADLDGGNLRHLTSDSNINSKPDWSDDGELVYFHRFEYGGAGRWQIFQIQPDGNGFAAVTRDQPGNNEFPDG